MYPFHTIFSPDQLILLINNLDFFFLLRKITEEWEAVLHVVKHVIGQTNEDNDSNSCFLVSDL